MRQAAAQAADAIRDAILAGRIPEGARIAELDLARQLSVSRTPDQGGAVPAGRRGAGRAEPEPRRPGGQLDLRGAAGDLRGAPAPRAVRGQPGGPAAVPGRDSTSSATWPSRCSRSARDQALTRIVELNQRFHGLLIARAGNPALASALTSVTHAVVVRRNFEHYSPGALARSLAHHLEIVAAARAGEPDWAEAVMRSHLYNARATMLSDQPEARP